MTHESREGFPVRVPVLFAEYRQNLQGSVLGRSIRKPLSIPFDPVGHVVTQAVLPTAEPEENQLEFVLPRVLDQIVDEGKVESPFLRLNQAPRNHGEDRVQVHFRKRRPDSLHVGPAGRAGIVELPAEHQVRFTVDDELGRISVLPEMREIFVRLCGRKNRGEKDADRDKKTSVHHSKGCDTDIRSWQGWRSLTVRLGSWVRVSGELQGLDPGFRL